MREISVTELQVTPRMIGNEWWLVTAGDRVYPPATLHQRIYGSRGSVHALSFRRRL